MAHSIQAILSKRKLTLIPDLVLEDQGGDRTTPRDNEFYVTVTNRSTQFTSFQLELLAPGLEDRSNREWYTVEPEICAKKPPGATTEFHVVIKKPPIPAYHTTLDLTLRIFSVECSDLSTREPLRLTLEKPRKPLRLYLPAPELKVFPGDKVEIPVIIYNLDSQCADLTLSLVGLTPSWCVDGKPDTSAVEQSLRLEPGDSQKTSFCCKPPAEITTLSQPYSFQVEVKSVARQYSTRESGTLHVLPQGTVSFTCDTPTQSIPPKGDRPDPKLRDSTCYNLQLANQSNQPQTVQILAKEGDRPLLKFTIPPPLFLQPEERQSAELWVQKQRPWFGRSQRFLFQVIPTLSPGSEAQNNSAVQVHPSNQTLELQIAPLIAPLLQVGGALLLLLLLWLLWLFRPSGHESTVNFVRFSGDGTTVLSGSSDQTVKRWFINQTLWQPDRLLRGQWQAQRLTQPEDIGQRIGKAVRVVHHGQRNNLVAVGLEDGTIQLWDTAFTTPQTTLYQGTDRVFDLVFTRDSRLLFSGHGSGNVRLWRLTNPSQDLPPSTRQIPTSVGELFPQTATEPERVYFPFAVTALALSEPDQAPPLLVIAGQFNQLALWDWNANRLYTVPYRWERLSYSFTQPVVGKGHIIESVATANHLLVTADNQGYISLWDLRNPPCQLQEQAAGICDLPLLDQWQDGHGGLPVRAVALSQDGCYLTSTGDDGQVMLWPLQNGRRRFSQQEKGDLQAGDRLAHYPIRLNSVDITEKDQTLWVTSDADRNRVMLYRIQRDNDHATCD